MQSEYISVGDRFTKLDNPNIVWVVRQVKEFPGLPPHAELHAQGYRNRMMLISQDALANHRMYHRIENS